MANPIPLPLRVVPPVVSLDTVACLELLLERARIGDVVGIAFAAVRRKSGYVIDTAGECGTNLTFARGMLAALDDKLAARIRGENTASRR